MSALITAKTRSVLFIACGGTGVNMLRAHRENQPTNADLSAEEQFCYVDTSTANLDGVSESDVFQLKNLDGSGGDRRRNAEVIYKALDAILLQHKPADLNVVLFSSAGGTGSVAGPLIWERLLAEGRNAIGIVIGSHDSLKRTSNTIGTLQGLEAAVGRVGRPFVMHYLENDPSKTPEENNVEPQFVMQTLSILASGKNGSLDSTDVRNLFDYHTVTHQTPALSMLKVYASAERLVSESKHVISLAALLKNRTELVPATNPDYDTVGYMPEGSQHYDNSFFFTVSTEGLAGIFGKLNEMKNHAEQKRKVTAQATSLLDSSTKTDTTSGLIF